MTRNSLKSQRPSIRWSVTSNSLTSRKLSPEFGAPFMLAVTVALAIRSDGKLTDRS